MCKARSIRDDADRPMILRQDNRAHVVLLHQARDSGEGLLRHGCHHALDKFFDGLHGSTLNSF